MIKADLLERHNHHLAYKKLSDGEWIKRCTLLRCKNMDAMISDTGFNMDEIYLIWKHSLIWIKIITAVSFSATLGQEYQGKLWSYSNPAGLRMKIDANLYFCSEPRRERTTRNMKLNCQVECNANKDGSERKLLEIFCEIVTMMDWELSISEQ